MQELKDFVKRFLVRAPNRRMGCMQGGVAEVKQHPWFKGFDWDALAARKMKPPYVPKARSPDRPDLSPPACSPPPLSSL